jgi:hypothetical protein
MTTDDPLRSMAETRIFRRLPRRSGRVDVASPNLALAI